MAEHDILPVLVPPVQWQELPEQLLEAVCGLLATRELRRARLVCKRWARCATFQAVSRAVQPYVLDMQRDPVRWKQLLSAGAKMMPQLASIQVHLSSRVKEAEAEENMAQLSVFSNLTDLKLVHIVGTVHWLEVLSTSSLHRPVLGSNWPLPVDALHHLPSLQRLTLQTANVPMPQELRALAAASALTHLALDQDNVKHACAVEVHFDALVALPSLRSLALHVHGNSHVARELSRLVGLEELKVDLFVDEDREDDKPSYQAGLLAAVLPPLTRLTRLTMGKMTSGSQHFNAALRKYADTLPPTAQGQEQQAGGKPGRLLLHLDVVLVEGEGAAEVGVDQKVLDALAPQISYLRIAHDLFRGGPLSHPSITEHACVAQQEPLPAITSRLAWTPNVTSLAVRRALLTDPELESLVSPCPHLTSLHVSYTTDTAFPLMANVCQDGDLLTSLRTLALHCSGDPPRPQTSNDLTQLELFLHFLPPQLRELSMRGGCLDTDVPESDLLTPAPDGTAASVGGTGLREVTLSHCSLMGLGIVGLLRQCASLRALSMTEVMFCGGFVPEDDDPEDGLFPRSVTSLKLDGCQYDDEDVPEELAGHRGYAWVCTLRNLRNLEWTGGMSEFIHDSSDIMRMLPEVVPSLPKLHNLQIAERWHGYGSVKYIRQMLQGLPSADYITIVAQDSDDDGFSMERYDAGCFSMGQFYDDDDDICMEQLDADMMYLLDLQLARFGFSVAGGYR